MTCTFFGHRDTPDNIKAALKEAIIQQIEKGVEVFYVGNNGNFDYLAQCILEEICNKHEKIKYFVAISKLGEQAILKKAVTILAEGLELVPAKFAISKRNEWLVKKADTAIVYYKHTFSNTYKLAEKAKKRGLKVINIADIVLS